jgi:hypothetical protein
MASNSPASRSVTAAAVVCIVGSGFTILFLAFAIFSVLIFSSPSTPGMPPGIKALSVSMLVLFVGVAIFGLVTGIGLIRLRNWARLSALIFAAVSALFSAFGVVLILLIALPAQPGAPAATMSAVRGFLAAFYALPLLIAIWWLILFNRAGVKAQFAGTALPADSQVPRKPALPLTILAWLFIVSTVLSAPLLLWSSHMPAFVFGHAIHGVAGKLIVALNSLLLAATGIGILQRKAWSYPLLIGSQLFWLASGIVTLLTPNHRAVMAAATAEMVGAMHLPQSASQPDYLRNGEFGIVFGIVYVAAVLGIALYYRARFLALAAPASVAATVPDEAAQVHDAAP